MKKRLIPPRHLKKVYSKEQPKGDLNLGQVENKKESHRLPVEMFEILGEIVSYIENINKLEGDKK
ncbi:MAG: hypothetical protein M0Q14_02775 [Tissierellaceae bacterium]|nr:hypothetical protein [Tissierellaceae bacterium]